MSGRGISPSNFCSPPKPFFAQIQPHRICGSGRSYRSGLTTIGIIPGLARLFGDWPRTIPVAGTALAHLPRHRSGREVARAVIVSADFASARQSKWVPRGTAPVLSARGNFVGARDAVPACRGQARRDCPVWLDTLHRVINDPIRFERFTRSARVGQLYGNSRRTIPRSWNGTSTPTPAAPHQPRSSRCHSEADALRPRAVLSKVKRIPTAAPPASHYKDAEAQGGSHSLWTTGEVFEIITS